jgi:CPA1 family monovalent cation:H+ antiporter
MRGVIALAAAISLPRTLSNDAPFPHRSLIIFLTFSVILVTLVLQGLTLPALIRALGLGGASRPHTREEEARRLVLEQALAYLDKRRQQDKPEFAGTYDDLAQHYRERLASVNGEANEDVNPERYQRYLSLSHEMLEVERNTALELRNQGRIDNEIARELEEELDLSETRLRSAIKHRDLQS